MDNTMNIASEMKRKNGGCVMTDEAKKIHAWLMSLASGHGFASYLIGAPEEAKAAAELIESLSAQFEQVKIERDAAVNSLDGDCHYCANYNTYKCEGCVHDGAFTDDDNWEWEGVEE